MSSTVTRYCSYSRSRSPSPYSKPRIMFATRDDDETIRNMCRPPAGWPASGTIPPLRSRSRTRQPCGETTTTTRTSCSSRGASCESLHKAMKDMESEVGRMNSYMDSFTDKMDKLATEACQPCPPPSPPPCPAPPPPCAAPPRRSCSVDETIATPDPVEIIETNGERRLVYSLDLGGFKPEEIKVNLCTDDGVVTIEACHEERESSHFFKRHYSRKFTIPEELRNSIHQHAIRSFFNDKGTLTVEAPLPPTKKQCSVTFSTSCDSGSNMQTRETGFQTQTLPNYYTQRVISTSGPPKTRSTSINRAHCKTCRCCND